MPSPRSDTDSNRNSKPQHSRRASRASTASNDTTQSFASDNTDMSRSSEPRGSSSGDYNQEVADPFSQLRLNTEHSPKTTPSKGSKSWNPITAVRDWFRSSDDVQPQVQLDPYQVLIDAPSGILIQLPATGEWISIGAHIDKWTEDLVYQIASQPGGLWTRSLSPPRRSSSIPRGNSSSREPGSSSSGAEQDNENGDRYQSATPFPRHTVMFSGSQNTPRPPRNDGSPGRSSLRPPRATMDEPSNDPPGSPAALGPVRSSPFLSRPEGRSLDEINSGVRKTQRANNTGEYQESMDPRLGIHPASLTPSKIPRQPLRWTQPKRGNDRGGDREADGEADSEHGGEHSGEHGGHYGGENNGENGAEDGADNAPKDDQGNDQKDDEGDDTNDPASNSPRTESTESPLATPESIPDVITQRQRALEARNRARRERYSEPSRIERDLRRTRRGLAPRYASRKGGTPQQHGDIGSRHTDNDDAHPSMHIPVTRARVVTTSFLPAGTNRNPNSGFGQSSSNAPGSSQSSSNPAPQRGPLPLDRLQSAHDGLFTATTQERNLGADSRNTQRLAGAQDGPAISLQQGGRSRRGDDSDPFTSAPTQHTLGRPIVPSAPYPKDGLRYRLPSIPSPYSTSGSPIGRGSYRSPFPSPNGGGSGPPSRGRGRGDPSGGGDPPSSPPQDGGNASSTHNSQNFGGNGNVGPSSHYSRDSGNNKRPDTSGPGSGFSYPSNFDGGDDRDDEWKPPRKPKSSKGKEKAKDSNPSDDDTPLMQENTKNKYRDRDDHGRRPGRIELAGSTDAQMGGALPEGMIKLSKAYEKWMARRERDRRSESPKLSPKIKLEDDDEDFSWSKDPKSPRRFGAPPPEDRRNPLTGSPPRQHFDTNSQEQTDGGTNSGMDNAEDSTTPMDVDEDDVDDSREEPSYSLPHHGNNPNTQQQAPAPPRIQDVQDSLRTMTIASQQGPGNHMKDKTKGSPEGSPEKKWRGGRKDEHPEDDEEME